MAYAGWGWGWNAAIDVEGVDVRTAWTVVDGDPAGPAAYYAEIKLFLPEEAGARIVSYVEAESVTLSFRKKVDSLAKACLR